MRRSRTTMSFLSMEKSREQLDLGTCIGALSGGAIKRRFSGTPLLPPLASRHATISDLSHGPELEHCRVVFTIEESAPAEVKDSNLIRCVGVLHPTISQHIQWR
ncbi:cAMP-specific 3',5'-cyclic phosphodiesterase 4C-like isoform X2 [Crotalus tigris]|uniref:cAMP-specific 3',5'-cyclic phosphodiesterase 4C-like isoform X2 n=1 Tax=Crotalus tigris TaxID=88082 RepID=UPI00192F875D|nr:cAMP-specific 3',5'-cyclic phosphodiesterase 4C-like isoform X2 [Crotalus tigris]